MRGLDSELFAQNDGLHSPLGQHIVADLTAEEMWNYRSANEATLLGTAGSLRYSYSDHGHPGEPVVSIALGQDPRQIAEPGRGADPNSVPDLAGAGTSVSATDTRKLGNHHPGDPPILVTISGRMSPTSLGGVLTDTVDVTAALGLCTGGAGGRQLVGIAHVDARGVSMPPPRQTTVVTGAASLVGPRANVVAGAREAAGQLVPQAAPGGPAQDG
jgi:hypothetical protein